MGADKNRHARRIDMNLSTLTSPVIVLPELAPLLVISPTLAVPVAVERSTRKPAVAKARLLPVYDSLPYRLSVPPKVTDALLMIRFFRSLFWKAPAGIVCAALPAISIVPSTTLNVPALVIVP